MIPTYNCANYLRETLQSVLAQDMGEDRMQIEVVDDCSTKDDPEAVVRELGRGRVRFHRQPCNVGATKNFNTCASRSVGQLVHLLHGDDLVEPGFYAEIDRLADRFPETAMIATRSFYIDESGNIFGRSPHVSRYTAASRDASPLYYGNPLRTPSIVLRRSCYEQYGGFCNDLVHVADWEMWARAISRGGGVMSNRLLTRYREFSGNETSRLRRTGENLRDFLRLAELFRRDYPNFHPDRLHLWIRSTALEQIRRFRQLRDLGAAEANHQICQNLGPARLPYLWRLKECAKSVSIFRSVAEDAKSTFFRGVVHAGK